MARLDKCLELNDTINSIINHATETSKTITDTETEALMWERMWDNIEQTERYFKNRYGE